MVWTDLTVSEQLTWALFFVSTGSGGTKPLGLCGLHRGAGGHALRDPGTGAALNHRLCADRVAIVDECVVGGAAILDQ